MDTEDDVSARQFPLLALPDHLISAMLSHCDARGLAALEGTGRYFRRNTSCRLSPCEEAARQACLKQCGGDQERAARFRWENAAGKVATGCRLTAATQLHPI